MKRLLAALGVSALLLSGCSVPQSFDGYVHAECDPVVTTADGDVTKCSMTQKPVPTVTQTVTVTASPSPSPTATATPTPTPTATTPAADLSPKNLRLDPSYTTTQSSFRLMWDNVTGSTIYKVYRDGAYVSGADGTNNTEAISGMSAGTTYSMQVSSTVSGTEYKSPAVNFTTAGAAPAPSPSPTATTTPPPSGAVVPAGVPGSWTQTFGDEFNGTALDKTKWSPHWFQEGGSMNNAPTYERNVAVANGELVLTLAAANSGALINTDPTQVAGGYQFERGVVEAKVWMQGNGTTNGIYNWPAWWTTGQSWPGTNEIDIAEGKGKMWVNYMNSTRTWFNYFPPGVLTGAWHTWTMQRTDTEVKVWLDGTLVHTFTGVDTPTGRPHYLVLNVGSGLGPAMYGVGSQMRVDYVRAWSPS